MTHLTIIRHGESLANVAGTIGSNPQVGLSEKGVQQATKTGAYLKDRVFDCVVSSDRPRAFRTAQLIVEQLNSPLEVATDTRLREKNWGEFEDKTREDFYKKIKENSIAYYDFVPQGGESFVQLAKRIDLFLEDLLTTNLNKKILLVAHDSINKVITKQLLNLNWEEFKDLKQPNTCISEIAIDKDKKVTVHKLGFVGHLL